MSTIQGNIKDKDGNRLAVNTTSAAVADVAKNQALSQTLVNTPDMGALGIPAFSTLTAYAKGDRVYYENRLWQFNTAHTKGSWNASQVDEISLYSLMQSANTMIAQLIEALDNTKADKDGTYQSLTAGMARNIVPLTSDAVVETGASFIGRTTAGNTTIPEEGVTIVARIVGAWNTSKMECFHPTGGFLSLGGNWFRPTEVLQGYKLNASGVIVADSSYTVAVVPCVLGESGTGKNNGFKVEFGTGATDTTIGVVGYIATKPEVGSTCRVLTANASDAYLPTGVGYMCVSVKSTNMLYIHPRWSGYMDGVYVAPSEDFCTVPQLVYGLSDLDYVERVSDTISRLHQGRGYIDLAAAEWSVSSSTSEGTTTYTFTANLPADGKSGGSIRSNYSGLSLTSRTLTITSTTITTVSALVEALTDKFCLYELTTEVVTDVELGMSVANSDFGGEFFIDTNVAPASVTFAYGVSYVGYIRDDHKQLGILGNVAARAISELYAKVEAIEKQLSDGIDTLSVKNLTVTRTATLPESGE